MKAWQLLEFSGLGAVRLATVRRPKPTDNEVLVRIRFAALNPSDRLLTERLYPARPALPHILGRDGTGIVEEIGGAVTRFKVADKVAILRGATGIDRPGTFAEFVAVPENTLVHAPSNWEDSQVAAAPLVYLTAHQSLFQWTLTPSSTIVVTGISGGVGIACLQLCKANGHRVIGLTRSSAKTTILRQLGCDQVIAGQVDLQGMVHEYTRGAGANLAIDTVAGPQLEAVIDCLGYKGLVSLVGQAGGPLPSFVPAKLFFRRLRIGGVSVSDYSLSEATAAWEQVVSLLNAHGMRPRVDSVFRLAELQLAFSRLREGPVGKVLLKMN